MLKTSKNISLFPTRPLKYGTLVKEVHVYTPPPLPLGKEMRDSVAGLRTGLNSSLFYCGLGVW